MSRIPRLITGSIALALVAAACGSDDDAEPEPASEASEAAPEPEQETEPQPDAEPEPTPDADAATDADAGSGEVADGATDPDAGTAAGDLRGEGLLTHDFGSPSDDVVADLTDQLGAPSSDDIVNYDVPSELEGLFAAGDPIATSFAMPVGRHVCWSNGLCAHFGAEEEADLALLGWRQTDGADALTTASGIAPGSAGADHADDIVVGTGGCFSVGEGDADGVTLLLRSEGVPFLVIDPGKSIELENQPPVNEVTVLELWAGEQLQFPEDDC